MNQFATLSRKTDDGRVRHAGRAQHDRLDVLREDVAAVGQHDHFLLAALDDKMPVRIESADIAGMEPAVFERRRGWSRIVVIAAGDVASAHQHFAVGGDAELDTGKRLAHGAPPRVEGMIQA